MPSELPATISATIFLPANELHRREGILRFFEVGELAGEELFRSVVSPARVQTLARRSYVSFQIGSFTPELICQALAVDLFKRGARPARRCGVARSIGAYRSRVTSQERKVRCGRHDIDSAGFRFMGRSNPKSVRPSQAQPPSLDAAAGDHDEVRPRGARLDGPRIGLIYGISLENT